MFQQFFRVVLLAACAPWLIPGALPISLGVGAKPKGNQRKNGTLDLDAILRKVMQDFAQQLRRRSTTTPTSTTFSNRALPPEPPFAQFLRDAGDAVIQTDLTVAGNTTINTKDENSASATESSNTYVNKTSSTRSSAKLEISVAHTTSGIPRSANVSWRTVEDTRWTSPRNTQVPSTITTGQTSVLPKNESTPTKYYVTTSTLGTTSALRTGEQIINYTAKNELTPTKDYVTTRALGTISALRTGEQIINFTSAATLDSKKYQFTTEPFQTSPANLTNISENNRKTNPISSVSNITSPTSIDTTSVHTSGGVSLPTVTVPVTSQVSIPTTRASVTNPMTSPTHESGRDQDNRKSGSTGPKRSPVVLLIFSVFSVVWEFSHRLCQPRG